MKKILVGLLAIAFLNSTVEAQTSAPAAASPAPVVWEYAMYTNITGIGQSWSTAVSSVSGKDINDIMTGLQCNAAYEGLEGLLNCAGERGWELIQFTQENKSVTVTSYIFKKRKS